jgi:hypothetical protein
MGVAPLDGHGEHLSGRHASGTTDSQELPALEMPYGQFRPASALRKCLNGWRTGIEFVQV